MPQQTPNPFAGMPLRGQVATILAIEMGITGPEGEITAAMLTQHVGGTFILNFLHWYRQRRINVVPIATMTMEQAIALVNEFIQEEMKKL